MIPFIIKKKPFQLVECGSEETGIVTLLKKHFISVAEQIDLDKIAVNSYKYQLLVGELIYKITQEEEVSQEEAQKAVERPNENLDISGKYLQDIEKVWEKFYDNKNDNLIRVTMALKYRALSEQEIDAFKQIQAPNNSTFRKESNDWSVSQTKELPQALFEEILEFIVGEQRGTGTTKNLSPSTKEIESSEKEPNLTLLHGENISGDSNKQATKDLTT